MLEVYIDGASRGNPGNSSYAFIIKKGDKIILEETNIIGFTTNNVAEYTALVKALENIVKNFNQEKEVVIFSDSELLTKQLMGIYKVRDLKLKALFERVKELRENLPKLIVLHIPREKNKRADKLCNESLNKFNY